ncbi:cytochrome P450 9e2-like [Zophobas morio]|uniref:cytochrome P450 9e2-like n=1 Tax=Zophobas morio TaxID=2755281 RepID=UPI003083B575
MWVFIAAAVLMAFGYWVLSRRHSYWFRKGVPQIKPTFIFGNMWPMILRKRSVPEIIQDMYNFDKDLRYVGIYQFLRPALMLRDPELIKQITVKDFDHFLDHVALVDPDADPLFGRNLFGLNGMKWREMRSTLSPTFTSSKMKHMFSLMSQNGEQFAKYFLQKNEDVIEVEMKDLAARFANDVIANTVFGFESDSLKEPNNEFYTMGKFAADFTSIRKILVFMGYILLPKLFKFFKVAFFPDKMAKFFRRIIKENIESREKHGTKRADMIGLLLEARKNTHDDDDHSSLPDTGFATVEESEIGRNQKLRKTTITDEDITAQAFVFFFAGFDPVSSLVSFMAYELGVNQEIQEKLKKEVDATNEKCNGKITYEALTTMKYMDMVVSEALRKWPNAIVTDRTCTKPYTIEPKSPNEEPVHLDKGDTIFLPVYAIQRDPEYYPEPERFDPERFSDENKNKIKPYTFFPFGLGPRNCIGSRFALMEIKLLFYYMLLHFEIIPIEKTQIPIRFSRKTINMSVEKGFWLGLQRRVK